VKLYRLGSNHALLPVWAFGASRCPPPHHPPEGGTALVYRARLVVAVGSPLFSYTRDSHESIEWNFRTFLRGSLSGFEEASLAGKDEPISHKQGASPLCNFPFFPFHAFALMMAQLPPPLGTRCEPYFFFTTSRPNHPCQTGSFIALI